MQERPNRWKFQRLYDRWRSAQGLNSQPVSFSEVAEARPNRNGQRCIDKVVHQIVGINQMFVNLHFVLVGKHTYPFKTQVEMVEETEYDDTVQCDHSYDRR